MTDSKYIYQAIGDIYNSCFPALKSWYSENGLILTEQIVIHHPEVKKEMIA
ncbi:hypothetical protein [Desulfobacula toluolica]|uniref:hypothetical protein n=1 Tax=Desulfobacula toluolica TaxID=28223 RepID=UPI000319ADBB|nr:hypothetical protein [Desulfobacula toluolica]